MTASIIDGKAAARDIREKVARAAADHVRAGGRRPGLAVVEVGDDPASKVYIGQKEKAAAEAGFVFRRVTLPESTTQSELEGRIRELNSDPAISGIIVQSPIPDHLDEPAVTSVISPDKDADGFHPVNQGKLFLGLAGFVPCTPAGILHLLDRERVPLEGARAVVIGRSHLVGRPVAMLLLHRNCTVTLCHSRTRDLASITREADILVSAVGKAGLVTGGMVKRGAVLIDVGMNPAPNPANPGKSSFTGDMDFASVSQVAGRITPVPGGVGPMTVAMLMANTARAAGVRLDI